jgi:hypothetical protein
MDSNSFIRNAEGLRSLMVNPKETRLYLVQTILKDEKYKCKASRHRNYVSYYIGCSLLQFRACLDNSTTIVVDFICNSKRITFMRNVILQTTEKGHLSLIISRFDPKTKPQDCKKEFH